MNWTEDSIRSMPEVRIGDCANGVSLEAMYASEEREGGTRTLDAGVPG